MVSSREVFAKRKEGDIEEAYNMALVLMQKPDKDDWDLKAFGWCIIDLIKRDAKSGNQQNMGTYARQLRELEVDPADNILTDQKEYALRLCNPNSQIILKAKALSKDGSHLESLNVYKEIFSKGDKSQDVQSGMAWELYRVAKSFLDQDPANFDGAKRFLNEYLQLEVDKPSLLHSCFLQLADKIALEGKLNMGSFAKIWKLEFLRPDDYEPFEAENGERYPSLAEKVVQHACKDSFSRGTQDELAYVLPFVNDCIERSPDNLWLKLSKAKALMGTGQNETAQSFGLQVVKNKSNNYWTWELLGDIYLAGSSDLAVACYCKALLCEKDINFVGKVKIKLAELLIKKDCLDRAKLEVDEIVQYRSEHGQNISAEAKNLISLPWYNDQQPAKSNKEFYREHAVLAEELLHANIPWKKGVLGETYTTKSNPNKPRRKIYIESNSLPVEVSFPESKIKLPIKQPGIALNIKGEDNLEGRFQIYSLEQRECDENWDIFEELVGVVDHINDQKKLLHFIVSRQIDGVIRFAELDNKFKVGGAIAVRVSKYISDRGSGYRVLTSSKTDRAVPENLVKSFQCVVREEKGMGFTDDGIFIPPPLIQDHSIADQDEVTGKAILSYNNKRSEWGWRALLIEKVASYR